MKKDIDVDAYLSEGNFEPLTQWLNEKVHCHGAMKKPNELMEMITGERLNSKYYCDYLEAKYNKLYGLN
jgi:carboxypeptidase Taq